MNKILAVLLLGAAACGGSSGSSGQPPGALCQQSCAQERTCRPDDFEEECNGSVQRCEEDCRFQSDCIRTHVSDACWNAMFRRADCRTARTCEDLDDRVGCEGLEAEVRNLCSDFSETIDGECSIGGICRDL